MTYRPDPIVCPKCGGPCVEEFGMAVTCMYFAPFYDEEGRRHIHGSNGSGVGYRCQAGHTWSPPEPKCWCEENVT